MAKLNTLRTLAFDSSIQQRCIEAIREAQGRAIRDNDPIPLWAFEGPESFVPNLIKIIITADALPDAFEAKYEEWLLKPENASLNISVGDFILDEELRQVITETKTKIFGA